MKISGILCIGTHVACILASALHDDPRPAYNSRAWVQLSETRYVYPDATVSSIPWDDPDEEQGNIVHSPCFIVEISSPYTYARDQGIKIKVYQECQTIQEFMLIDTEFPKVQLYRRERHNRWSSYLFNAGDEVELASLGARFPVIGLYKKTRLAKGNAQ